MIITLLRVLGDGAKCLFEVAGGLRMRLRAAEKFACTQRKALKATGV